MTKDEALRIVLKNLKLIEAQDQGCGGNVTEAEAWRSAKRIAWHTINFVEEALAQPEPELTAKLQQLLREDRYLTNGQAWDLAEKIAPFCAHPKEWQDLTDEQIKAVNYIDMTREDYEVYSIDQNSVMDFARAILKAAKEKNT